MPSLFNTHSLRRARALLFLFGGAACARAYEGESICPCHGFGGNRPTRSRLRSSAWPGRTVEPTKTQAPAPPAEGGSPAQQKRRRGNRGGRNRKKPGAERVRDRRGEGREAEGRRSPSSLRRSRSARSRPTAAAVLPAPPPAASPRAAPGREARAARLGRRQRAARRRPRGRPGRRGVPRAAGAPLDRGEHLQGRRRQRPPGDGGRVRRDRPREERLPLRGRDRRPRARRPPPQRPPYHRPDQPRRGSPRPGGQGPDEDEGRAAHHRDLAPGPLRRLRPERRRASASPAGSRRTSAPACATSSRRSPRSRAA